MHEIIVGAKVLLLLTSEHIQRRALTLICSSQALELVRRQIKLQHY